jgi:hypothetical protein
MWRRNRNGCRQRDQIAREREQQQESSSEAMHDFRSNRTPVNQQPQKR